MNPKVALQAPCLTTAHASLLAQVGRGCSDGPERVALAREAIDSTRARVATVCTRLLQSPYWFKS